MRRDGIALRYVQSGQIRIYWSAVQIPSGCRTWLEKRGLAEFRRVFCERAGGQKTRTRAESREQLAVWFARLTCEGVRMRDAYDRREAVRKDKRIRRGQKVRHDRHVSKRADGPQRQDPQADGDPAG